MNISSTTTSPIQPSSGSVNSVNVDAAPAPTKVDQEEGLDPTRVTISYGRTEAEQREFDYRVAMEHRSTPYHQAKEAISTIDNEVNRIQKELAAQRPDLAKSGWDFTIERGKLKVTGDVSAADKLLIEAKLNKGDTMKAAVASYMSAVGSYLETSETNPAYKSQNSHTNKVQSYEFHDVAGQLEGKIAFRELLAGTANRFDGADVTDGTSYAGMYSMDIVASMLS